MPLGVLRSRLNDQSLSPTLIVVCAGFEGGAWRAQDLVDDLFQRHLPSFALSFTDLTSIDGETAARSLKQAADIVYNTNKYGSRGEMGELILHGVAKDFFGALPAVSKIYYKDSANDTVKGFDCVHVTETQGELVLWLGEVKFYSNLAQAIRDAADELRSHLEAEFLKREFLAITNKLDPAWPHTESLIEMLDAANSLDDIVSSIRVPVLLTYDSKAVADSNAVSPEYVAALEIEARTAWESFASKLDLPLPVTLELILLPVEEKARLAGLFHQKLSIYKHL